jgi:hypothetical protein
MNRPRSDALYGPADPRWRSAAELDFARELSKPAIMDPSLQSFIQKIFQRHDLMAGPDDLAVKIYKIYNGEGLGDTPVSGLYADWTRFVKELWYLVGLDPQLSKGSLQFTKLPLQKLIEILEHNDRPKDACFKDFIYFNVQAGQPQARVYANAKFSHALPVFACLKDYIAATLDHGILALKLVGPAAIEARNDTFVIYCLTKAAADRLAARLVTLQGHFDADLPAMTTPVQGGVGVSTGAEPPQGEIGLGPERPEGYHGAQSFGGLRSELIAGAILNFNANKHIYGNGFEAFSKFVCVAFRGYGLDPARPGDNA